MVLGRLGGEALEGRGEVREEREWEVGEGGGGEH